MTSEVYLTDQAQKDLTELPKSEIKKIQKKLFLLEKEPFSGKKLAGNLKCLFSLKAWPYRIVYLVNRKQEVWIIHIMHRKEIYKKLR